MNKVRVDIRIKNNRLYRKIKEHYPNVRKFALAAHTSIHTIYGLITLRLSPYSLKTTLLGTNGSSVFKPHSRYIAELLECEADWLFPWKLYEKHHPIQATIELPLSACLPALPRYETLQLPMEELETRTLIEKALKTLPQREEEIINMRFGFKTGAPMTLREVGEEIHLSTERIRQIEGRALRLLRNPNLKLKNLI